jgi:hypothetical protein
MEPTRMKVSSPADLLGLVPYLLGFQPSESLVVVLLKNGRVLLTARLDLVPADAASDVIDAVQALAGQHDASGLLLVAYSERSEPTREVLAHLIRGLSAAGLLEAIYVDGRRWWSLTCSDGCCPPEGLPYDLESMPMVAEAVYAGLTAAPDRGAIEDQVKGPSAADAARLAEDARSVSIELRGLSLGQRKAAMSSSVRDFVADPRWLSDAECASFALLAFDIDVRDVAWALMSRRSADSQVDLWRQVVARTTAPYEAAPLCLLGMAAWIAGNGALQNCCLDRVRLVEPNYSMAELLAEINQRALSPSLWDVLAGEIRAQCGSC